jgi:hypothetical protein
MERKDAKTQGRKEKKKNRKRMQGRKEERKNVQ